MHTVHIGESSYPLPSRWDELSAVQLRRMAWLSGMEQDPVDIAKLVFLIQTLSLTWWQRMRLQYFYYFQADTIERADLLICTQSFHEFRSLTAQKIKKIRRKFVLFYGPDSGLANCTFWEYIKAEQYYLNYLEKKEPVWLDKLIATLYRPSKKNFDPNTDTDRRIHLNDMAVRFRMEVIKGIEQDTKLAVLLWFSGCREQISNNFPLVFKKQEAAKEAASPQRSKSSKPNGVGWMQLISELSGSMDQYEKIGNTNLYIALTDISHRIKKSEEAKKEALKRARLKK